MLGFLTSRVKHTGSLPTPHSTRYSSLMFKGGELTRTGRRRVHQSGEKTRTILSLVCFCFVGFSPFFFWSCKVSGDGRTEFQSQAQRLSVQRKAETQKSKTLHVWALTACHLIPHLFPISPFTSASDVTAFLLLFCSFDHFYSFFFFFVHESFSLTLSAPRCCRTFVGTLCRVPALLLGGAVGLHTDVWVFLKITFQLVFSSFI